MGEKKRETVKEREREGGREWEREREKDEESMRIGKEKSLKNRCAKILCNECEHSVCKSHLTQCGLSVSSTLVPKSSNQDLTLPKSYHLGYMRSGLEKVLIWRGLLC